MLDYFELNQLLSNVEAEVCAAGCHGFLCGQVCVPGYPMEDLWQEYIDARTKNDDLVDDCYGEIKILLADIIDSMNSSDMGFQLMLPDDDSDLTDRVDALAEWCHGFLNGYGAAAGDQGLAMTEECREILEDFTRICRAGIDEGGNEEDEQALAELIEYVRMGTMLIYEDLFTDFRMIETPEVLH